jgi:hypothetical protein
MNAEEPELIAYQSVEYRTASDSTWRPGQFLRWEGKSGSRPRLAVVAPPHGEPGVVRAQDVRGRDS